MKNDRLKQLQLDTHWLSEQLSRTLADNSDLSAIALGLSLQSELLLSQGLGNRAELETLIQAVQQMPQHSSARWLISSGNDQLAPDSIQSFPSEKTLRETIPDLTSSYDNTIYCALHVPFIPGSFIATVCATTALRRAVKSLRTLGENILREVIAKVLQQGIQTDTALPDSDREWQHIVDALKCVPDNALLPLLELGGFADRSLGESGEMEDGRMVLRCQECIYYLPRRKWCDFPELPLPVEPHWYCRLWKL